MKISTKVLWMVSTLFFLSTLPALGADVAKIGVIDFQRFLGTSKAGQEAQAKFKDQGTKMETELKKKETEIKDLRDRLERETMVMTQEVREQKEREYRIKVSDFKALEKKSLGELKELENNLVSKIRDDLLALIEEIGKRDGYLLIIDKAVAHYHPAKIDITDELIQIYNERGDKAKK